MLPFKWACSSTLGSLRQNASCASLYSSAAAAPPAAAGPPAAVQSLAAHLDAMGCSLLQQAAQSAAGKGYPCAPFSAVEVCQGASAAG